MKSILEMREVLREKLRQCLACLENSWGLHQLFPISFLQIPGPKIDERVGSAALDASQILITRCNRLGPQKRVVLPKASVLTELD